VEEGFRVAPVARTRSAATGATVTEWTAPPPARAPTAGISIRSPLSPKALGTLAEVPSGDGAPAVGAVALGSCPAPRAEVGDGAAVGGSGTTRAAASATPVASDANRLKAVRILAADDNSTNQMLLRRFLQKLGYTNTTIVSDGHEALLELHKQHYDLLLTDCHMPRMDGYELCRQLRASDDAALAGMPVIAITASAMSADIDRCHAAGMDDHLAKPYTASQLGVTVSKWLQRALPSTSTLSSE